MAVWPRKIHGHTVAREVDFRRGASASSEEVLHAYQCVGCGLQFNGPDDPRLREVECIRSAGIWKR